MALRPLSELGEGYCRVCHFIEPLQYDGKIAQHYRGVHSAGSYLCDGSYTTPPRVAPKESRLAAFRVTPRVTVCTWCRTEVKVSSEGRIFKHPLGADVCKGSLRQAVRR